MTADPRVFQIRYSFNAPGLESPDPQGRVKIIILGNGGNTVLFALPGSRIVKIDYVSVPNAFELRALGL